MSIFGIGTDLVNVSRIQDIVERDHDYAFRKRVFSQDEIAYCEQSRAKFQRYAARFAAKEAIFKAFGDKPYLEWKSIRILKDDNGKPFCQYDNSDFNGEIMISLSHTHNYAVASAIITEE